MSSRDFGSRVTPPMTPSHIDLGLVLHFMRAAMRGRAREIQSGRGTTDIQYGGLIEPTLLKMGQAQIVHLPSGPRYGSLDSTVGPELSRLPGRSIPLFPSQRIHYAPTSSSKRPRPDQRQRLRHNSERFGMGRWRGACSRRCQTLHGSSLWGRSKSPRSSPRARYVVDIPSLLPVVRAVWCWLQFQKWECIARAELSP